MKMNTTDIYRATFDYEDVLAIVEIIDMMNEDILNQHGMDGATDKAIGLLTLFKNSIYDDGGKSTYECLEDFMHDIGNKIVDTI